MSSSLERIQAAIAVLHTGDRPAARAAMIASWHELAGDRAARCVLAHYIADAHDEPHEVLAWDERALAAADALTDAELQRLHPSLSLREFFPSLYLNVAEAHRALGDSARAREFVEKAQTAADELPEAGYGQFIRGGIERLAARLATGD